MAFSELAFGKSTAVEDESRARACAGNTGDDRVCAFLLRAIIAACGRAFAGVRFS